MSDQSKLKLYVDEFDNLDELQDEQGDESGEHLRKQTGKLGVVWMDCTRHDDPPGTYARTGLPGCLETTLPVAVRIRDCVNACVGIKDPASEIAKMKSAVAVLRQMVCDLTDGHPVSYRNFNEATSLVFSN